MQYQHNNKLPYATYDLDYQHQRNQLNIMISEVTNNSEDEDPLPTFEEFQCIINDYLSNLSPKKKRQSFS